MREVGIETERILNILKENIGRIAELCRRHGVRTMCAFGSVVSGRFREESDIDILVSFDKERVTDYFSNFFDLKYALEGLLGRAVDLVEEQAVRNKYLRKSIDETKVVIYG